MMLKETIFVVFTGVHNGKVVHAMTKMLEQSTKLGTNFPFATFRGVAEHKPDAS